MFLRINCDILCAPNGQPLQIRVLTYFSCLKFDLSDTIYFAVDTGSDVSLIGENDAKRLGISYANLELLPESEWAKGIGGKSPVYRINGECHLTFPTDKQGHFQLEKTESFRVIKIELEDEKTKTEVVRLLPSLLGMDLIAKYKLVVTSKVAYLEL